MKRKTRFSFSYNFFNFDRILMLIHSKDRKNHEVYDKKQFTSKKTKMTQIGAENQK